MFVLVCFQFFSGDTKWYGMGWNRPTPRAVLSSYVTFTAITTWVLIISYQNCYQIVLNSGTSLRQESNSLSDPTDPVARAKVIWSLAKQSRPKQKWPSLRNKSGDQDSSSATDSTDKYTEMTGSTNTSHTLNTIFILQRYTGECNQFRTPNSPSEMFLISSDPV